MVGDRARLPGRIVHVHIPKTAGTALAQAFQAAVDARVYPARYEEDFHPETYDGHDFFTGHIGFKVASGIGGDLITVLRDPAEQFLSTYYFFRQMYESGEERSVKTTLAARYDLDAFLRVRDEPDLEQTMVNRMTWQLAWSHRLEARRELTRSGVDDRGLVRMARDNLGRFAIVGLQDDIDGLLRSIRERYNVSLSVGRVNVTRFRLALNDIPMRTRERMEWWIHLDQQLWSAWTFRDPAASSAEPGL